MTDRSSANAEGVATPDSTYDLSAEQVFDRWAEDYHAPGMEDGHWPAVREAFDLIPPSDGQYLEVGVGNGYAIRYMAEHQFRDGFCVGLDVSRKMAELTRQRTADLENVRIEAADFLSWATVDRFDVIFSMEVFYYLPDMRAGLRTALDLLKPGGLLMVLVNHYAEHTHSHGWPDQLNTPMTLWSGGDYLRAFEAVGFENVRQGLFHVPDDGEKRRVNPGTLGTWGQKPRHTTPDSLL